jgi:hypothetical protein
METNEQKQLLKVGDKVYQKDYPRYPNQNMVDWYNYKSATVQRLTKTQAILSNGVKLINEPENGIGWKEQGYLAAYPIYGDRWNKYFIETPESLADGMIQKKRAKVQNWFVAQKFTEEQKIAIYNLFNPTE